MPKHNLSNTCLTFTLRATARAIYAVVLFSIAFGSGAASATPDPARDKAATKCDRFVPRMLFEKPHACDIYCNLPVINPVAIRIPNGNLAKLATLALVKRVPSDMTVGKCDGFTRRGSIMRSGA